MTFGLVGARWRRWLPVVVAVSACQASTTRPQFVPFPEAAHGVIGFNIADRVASIVRVTDTVAGALQAEGIPITHVRSFDGYLETGWFDANTLKPTDRRPIGPDVVRVRAWVNPGRPGFSEIEVETAFVPVADPSLPLREQEAPAPDDHPVAKKIAGVVKELVKRYGEPVEKPAITKTDSAPPLGADSTAADSTAAKTDTTAAKTPSKKPVKPPPSPPPAPAPPPPAPKRDTTPP